MATCRGIFIVAAKRTPFGTFGGKLKGVSVLDLGVSASKAAIAAANIDPQAIDSVIIGNVNQSATDIYLARHTSLHAGIPVSVPALTINRLCGSGFQSLVNGVQELQLGVSNVALTGATESMSLSPFLVRDVRFGVTLGNEVKMEDTLWTGLTDNYAKLPMALTAEKLGDQYDITRQQCDEFALTSQQRWSNADKNGYFAEELFPLELKGRKGPEQFTTDEHPRPESTLEGLLKLKPVFKKDGLVSAGNASGISDGAGAIIVANEEAVKKHNLTPLAEVLGYCAVGVDPTIMGIGPAFAIKKLLKATSMEKDSIDLFEVNEAFAAQYLSVEKELGLDRDKTNVNGGAIALGHPLAASGTRIMAHLTHELRRRQATYAIGSACIGGGQGIAVLIRRV